MLVIAKYIKLIFEFLFQLCRMEQMEYDLCKYFYNYCNFVLGESGSIWFHVLQQNPK